MPMSLLHCSEIPNLCNFEDVKLNVREGGKSVAVFCGSGSDTPPIYYEHARKLGILLAQTGCALIYGGGSWGLMGATASSAYEAGIGSIVGVLPDFMRHSAGLCYGQTVMVNNMAVRKSHIGELSDVFVALPGGFGTMDEVTEMLTWNQLGFMNKAVFFLNTDGFFDAWWSWCQRAQQDGFIKPVFFQNVYIADTPEELMEQVLTRKIIPIEGKYFTKA